MIPNWTGGRNTALDVTVINPLQINMVTQSANNPGHALSHAYTRKIRQSQQAYETEGICFLPLPVETLGGWHEVAVDQIKKLGRALARNTGAEEDVAIRHLFQRLGILLAKGNAALFLNRVPTFPESEVDGVA